MENVLWPGKEVLDSDYITCFSSLDSRHSVCVVYHFKSLKLISYRDLINIQHFL